MEEIQPKYNNLFTIEERKRIIAQTMGELRKAKGLSQKEVAAEVGISQATYSAYERGRNEPPVEILVRLSYLFGCPVDFLVQRDRLYKGVDDFLEKTKQAQAEIAQLRAAMAEKDPDNPVVSSMLDMIEGLTVAISQTMQRKDIAQGVNDPLK